MTPELLTRLLRESDQIKDSSVQRFAAERIGEAYGFAARSFRIELTYDAEEPGAPASIVAKTPWAATPTMEPFAREIRFYQELAPQLPIPTVPCLGGDPTANPTILLLQDLCHARAGDALAGASEGEIDSIVRHLARMHAFGRRNPDVLESYWLRDFPGDEATTSFTLERFGQRRAEFEVRYQDRIDDPLRRVLNRIARSGEEVIAELREAPRDLLHGDAHIDNFLFLDDGFFLLDWQSVGHGPGPIDLAVFLCHFPHLGPDAIPPLIEVYREALAEAGVEESSADLRRRWELALVRTISGVVIWLGSGKLEQLAPRERKVRDLLFDGCRIQAALVG